MFVPKPNKPPQGGFFLSSVFPLGKRDSSATVWESESEGVRASVSESARA